MRYNNNNDNFIYKLKRLDINVIKDMPQRNHIPALAELVYKPVSCLIKQEALKVSNNCVTKFHLDEDEEDAENVLTKLPNAHEDKNNELSLCIETANETVPTQLLTIDDCIKRR